MGMIFRFVSLLILFSLLIQKNLAQTSFAPSGITIKKKLIIQLKSPGFFRAGDHLEIPVIITNMSDSEVTGQVQLLLFDPETHQPVDGWFSNRQANQYFTAEARQGTSINFPVDVPYEYNRLLNLRIEAELSGGEASAIAGEPGQEMVLPVFPNRTLLTESLPINMSQGGTKDFHFDDLLKKGNNESISQHVFKIEFTSNPAWYAMESFPYLMESTSEWTEDVFERFFASAMGISIQNNSSEIRETLKKWKPENPVNQYLNADLKSVLREEMPWVLEPKNQLKQQEYLSGLLDIPRLKNEIESGLDKLESLQSATGGFSWYKGEPEDRFLTQYILIGIGRLKKMSIIDPDHNARLNRLATKSIVWVDQKIKEDLVDELKRNAHPGQIPLSPIQIQWLFMQSYFPEIAQSVQVANVSAYISQKAEAAWPQQNKMLQAMICIWLYRVGKAGKAAEILASLKKNAVHHEEFGIYWNDIKPGTEWYQAPPETISILIEALSEINPDYQSVAELKTRLLSQKQSLHWSTTRSTADACYALLFQQGDSLVTEPRLQIQLGKKELPSQSNKASGFYSNSIFPPYIKAEMGAIRLTLSPAPGEKKISHGWGAAYWQYFEEYDRSKTKIGQAGPMFIKKSIFLKKNTGQTAQLVPITEKSSVRLGDKLIVRIDLTVEKDLEYVQLKDNWASCLQPIDTLSGFRKKGSLRYFEKSGDGSTHFIFNRLKKGKYLFEYEMVVHVLGTFNCGSAITECIYAPQFRSSTQPMKINVIDR